MSALSAGQLERLAVAIHECYLAEQTRDGVAMGATPAMVVWSLLDEDLRESNRDQARDVSRKLARIGCALIADAAAGGGREVGFAFTPAELDLLASQERRRWRHQRTFAGWVYGRERDERRKRHPSLVARARLPECERDKDRDAVRNIPAVAAAAGLRVVRV